MKSGICATVLLASAFLGLGSMTGCTQPNQTAQTAQTASTPTTAESSQPDPSILKLLYSRAPVTLNPHLATGYQDFEAARIVYEPLASYNAKGELIPFLAAEIPTAANGGVAKDGKSVTWKLRPGVAWSDGKLFTADDVVFTFQFIRNPQVAAATAQFYEGVKSVEAVDKQTVKITFAEPTAAWSIPFTGQTGVVLPKHVFEKFNNFQARSAQANVQPIGTGPYTVLAFSPGKIIYNPNTTYWGGAPAFKSIELTGGIAPYAAARDVLRAGTADFANNIQVEASALKDLEKDAQGRLITTFGSNVERIMLNFSNPFAKTESGERSSPKVPHPYFSDIRVREAINLAIDRDAIARELYGNAGKPTAQLLVEPAQYASANIPYEYNLNQAKALLDAAGWVDTNKNGIRDKGGVEMEVLFQSAVNPVRQETQAIVKKSLEDLGMKVEVDRVRVDDFFSANPEQTNSLNHFYADMQVYSTGNESPDPITYMSWWTCAKIASQENKWQEPNNARYCNPEYDQLWQAAAKELDPQKRADLFKQMDELLAMDVAVIPIVHRAIANAVSNTLTGLEPTPWDASTWDIKNWKRSETTPGQGENKS
ncbi:MAG TPA: peptide ABC transporter substrate-binding protein [Leptolyngbyaceae cyanobacterium]